MLSQCMWFWCCLPLISSVRAVIDVRSLILSNTTTHTDWIYFTHIMKCGGSTLHDLFLRFKFNHNISYHTSEGATSLPSLVFDGKPNLPSTGIQLKLPRTVTGKTDEGYSSSGNTQQEKEDKLRTKLVIVLVREPSARVISHYYQVRPWGSHRGNDPICTSAAAQGFESFLKKCKFATNFQSSYHKHEILSILPRYSLVVPFEQYNQGLVLLHMYVGFQVQDILYIVKKNYSSMPKEDAISAAAMQQLVRQNEEDYKLHAAARKDWNNTIATLVAAQDKRFERTVQSFLLLLDEFHDAWNYKYGNVSVPPTSDSCHDIPQHCHMQLEVDFIKNFCTQNIKCKTNNMLA